jgi:hypothetical protein
MHHLIKHGYDEYATWETVGWFINTMKDILVTYRTNHQGYPVVSFDDQDQQKEFEKEYDADLDMMISLLDDMDEGNPRCTEMYAAKDKFFELFSKHFYSLWD